MNSVKRKRGLRMNSWVVKAKMESLGLTQTLKVHMGEKAKPLSQAWYTDDDDFLLK
jgi:hypothetical protein